jgi:hypothetical protein
MGTALARIGGSTATIAVIARTEDEDREARVFTERTLADLGIKGPW